MASTNANGFFSSLTSLFGGGNGSIGPGSSGFGERKKSAFGSGLPSSARRGPPGRLGDDGGAWSLPYSQYSGNSNVSGAHSGQYPPHSSPGIGSGSSGYGRFDSASQTNLSSATPTQSTSTLVPAQGRPSMTLSSNVSIPSTAYPPLRHTWKRIRAWCENHYSELDDTLNWPATEAAIDDLELTIGFTLPTAVRDSYLCYDGQEIESNNSCSDGLFFGLPLLSLEQIAEEWRFWRGVDDDATSGANAEVKGWMSSCPNGWIRHEYSCRGWIPLVTDHGGNYIGVDMMPPPNGGGAPGQVILFGRDFDTKIVLWRGEGEGGWGRFLQYVAEELESGEMWTLDDLSAGSEDEEDAIGYESYFSGGGAGAAKGGGDRGGEGNAGFKLTGEYKGWPVLEAWADRSMRCWEEMGMQVGQPPWHPEPPSVILEEVTGSRPVNEDGEAMDAEGSGSRGGLRHPRSSSFGSSTSSSPRRASSSQQGQSSEDTAHEGDGMPRAHPLEGLTDSLSPPGTPNGRRISDTLSPPPPSTTKASRSRQKQREGSDSSLKQQQQQQQRQRKPIPAPAAPLDLPTIDDVRAAHAAAMASQQRGGNFHFDMDRGGSKVPAGMGGMGMGMGMRSTSTSRYRDPAMSRSASTTHADEDGLELENRSSSDNLYSRSNTLNTNGSGFSTRSSSTLSDVVIDGVPAGAGRDSGKLIGTPTGSPRGSISSQTARPGANGRILYSPNGDVPNLIDAPGSLPGSPQPKLASYFPSTNEPHVSSPLATQAPVFSSMQNTPHATLQMDEGMATPTKNPAVGHAESLMAAPAAAEQTTMSA